MLQFIKVEKGFTLVEILITLAILSIVLMIIYTTYANSVNTVEYNQDLIEVQQKARLALDIISSTIRGAFYDKEHPQLKFIGKDRKFNEYNIDSLDFITANHPFRVEDEKHDLIELGYSLVFNPEKVSGALLVRKDIDIGNDEIDQGGESWELCDNIEGLNITYYDYSNNIWVNDWDSAEQNGLPKAVKTEIILRMNKDVYTYSTMINLPFST